MTGATDPLALLDQLARVADAAPDAVAVVTPGRGTLTRAALVQAATDTARGLAAHGLAPGDRVLFSVRPGAEALVLMLAVVAAGGVLVAGDPGVGDRVFAARMALVRPRWVMAESLLLAAMAHPLLRRIARRRGADLPSAAALAGVRRVRVGPPLPGALGALTPAALRSAGRGTADLPAAPGGDAAAFVVFTSGTTGAPRAVVHTRRSLAATLALVGGRLGAGPGDAVYTRDLHLALPALLAGARVVMPRELGFDPARTRRDLAARAVTHAFLVTADAQTLLDHLAGDVLPAPLRTLLLGAAPVPAAFLRRLAGALPAGAEAWAVYGMTELLPAAAVTLADKLAYADAGGTGDLLGAPVPGVAARVERLEGAGRRGRRRARAARPQPVCRRPGRTRGGRPTDRRAPHGRPGARGPGRAARPAGPR
jgi:acyl-CoA synthetase (AMP-forming)/AMP-acid ligase II